MLEECAPVEPLAQGEALHGGQTQHRPELAKKTRRGAAFTGTVTRIPTREEIAPIVNEQLIVEFYSKA